MSDVHIYRAKDQPATRAWHDLSIVVDGKVEERGFWIEYPPHRLLPCFKCRKKRWAANLIAHVYYDGTYFFCRKGKGCKA